MPVTDYQHQGTSSPFLSIGRSILSIRRDQVPSMDGVTVASDGSHDLELESFQRQVADLFHDLDAGDDEVLSLTWIRKLLETFIICQEEFRSIVLKSKSSLSRPPVDRMVSEFFERSVKALDVCNAIRDGIDQVRTWSKHLEIVRIALNTNGRAVGEAHFRRAKKALTDLTIAVIDEKDSSSSVISQQRNRSFGRRSRFGNNGHFRSLSWSVSRNWSAARQLQMIGNNLTAPRNNEIVATNGLAVPIFTMNSVLLFVMWALVAAIPCQDRGLQAHFSIPRGFTWAAPFMALHDRILEESKKRDRKNSNGLLKEIHQIEKCGRHLLELVDSAEFPLSDEKELKIREEVQELASVCDVMKEGLEPLERQVREVFHRIVRSRMEGLDSLGHA